MKVAIVYVSQHHGNTRKVAEAMAQAVGADLFDAVQACEAKASLSSYDVIGFGSGIYFGKHHESLLKFVLSLDLAGKRVFAFSTSGIGSSRANRGLLDLLKQKGANILGDFACKGYDTFGPFKLVGGIAKGHPSEKDLERAREFVRGMVAAAAR